MCRGANEALGAASVEEAATDDSTAPVLPHTERQDEEAKANHGAGRTGTP
jgi:hypothetical protein